MFSDTFAIRNFPVEGPFPYAYYSAKTQNILNHSNIFISVLNIFDTKICYNISIDITFSKCKRDEGGAIASSCQVSLTFTAIVITITTTIIIILIIFTTITPIISSISISSSSSGVIITSIIIAIVIISINSTSIIIPPGRGLGPSLP